jgi:hypothetical protein
MKLSMIPKSSVYGDPENPYKKPPATLKNYQKKAATGCIMYI